jgi:hypothetical protein
MKSRLAKTKSKERARQRHLRPGCVGFPEMKGRTVERIEVWLSSGYRCVSIRFEDNTDFTVEFDTRLVCQALHSDWKTGNMRVLKRWPAIEE